MKRKSAIIAVLAALTIGGTMVMASPALAHGCSPGFWKTHPEAWPAGYSPGQTVDSVFTGADSSLGTQTLLQALYFKGGPDLIGGEEILLHQATAAVLNSAQFHLKITVAYIVSTTNDALASQDRDTMVALGARWDTLNNRTCPL
jgi:hypothetical protein